METIRLDGTAPTNTLKTGSADGCRIKDLKRLDVNLTSSLKDSKGRKLSHLAWLSDEPTVYKMLLRGHAPVNPSSTTPVKLVHDYRP